jgi:hypothetical protein
MKKIYFGVMTYLSEEGYHFISPLFKRRKSARQWLRENNASLKKYPVRPWIKKDVWHEEDIKEQSYIALQYWCPMDDKRVRSRRSKKWNNHPYQFKYLPAGMKV